MDETVLNWRDVWNSTFCVHVFAYGFRLERLTANREASPTRAGGSCLSTVYGFAKNIDHQRQLLKHRLASLSPFLLAEK